MGKACAIQLVNDTPIIRDRIERRGEPAHDVYGFNRLPSGMKPAHEALAIVLGQHEDEHGIRHGERSLATVGGPYPKMVNASQFRPPISPGE